ncbi:MAG: hypothetical protein KGY67_00385 [Candidatus Thermoplasmatota archaeon]|nr:hypothetical protein [Candidatus Thermoplasmatota archaeon]
MKQSPKFKFCIEKELLNHIFNYTEPLIDEISPYFTNEGLYICEVDLAHVVMYSGFIAKQKFKEYTLNRNTRLTVDISRLKLSTMLSGKNVTMLFDGNKDSRLQIDTHARIGLLENGKNPKEPSINLPVEINLDENDIQLIKKMIEIGKKISDTLHFKIDKDKLHLIIKGDEDSYDKPLQAKIIKKDDTPIKSIFSTEYLSLIFNNLKSKNKIRLQLGNNQPMRVKETGEYEKHMFLIAPRIEEEI